MLSTTEARPDENHPHAARRRSARPAAAGARRRDEESPALGHALTLIHLFVRIAAESETPQQSLRAIDDVLLGRNPAANEAVAGLMKEMLADVPPQHRATIAAIGRDLAARGEEEPLGEAAGRASIPLQARKELTSMGLTYHDSKQFLDAVKRNDAIAAELFIAGRGVDLSARDFWGRDAVDFARANGNERLAELIAQESPRSALSAASAATAAVSVRSTRGPSEAGTKPARQRGPLPLR